MNRAKELLYHNHLRKQVVLSTVSGILTTEPGMIQYFAKTVPSCDIITTKSYQVIQTFGHREPVLCSVEEGNFGNFVGLRNPGMDAVYPELEKIVQNEFRPILNISLSANEVRNFITLVRKFDKLADMLELNFSCPHAQAGFGASIGSDAAVASDYVCRICQEVPDRHALLIIKLTPNVENIGEIAKAVIEAGADGVAAINTVGPLKHIDPVSGSVIFSEAEGGKGGASGEWVKQKALDCVREIRLAIGDEPILLGMGGVSTPADVRNMIDAGADSVGIGSVLSRLEMKDYENYFSALKNNESVSEYVVSGNKLQYRRHTVLSAKTVGGDMKEITLNGELDCRPGQFAFLWIPQIGEKPFSVAGNRPLKFLIKKCGQFTDYCFGLKEGDTVYTRGLYGKPMKILPSKKALLIAGGSGVAVLPLIGEELKKQNVPMTILVGVVEKHEDEPLQNDLEAYGETRYIADDGKPGRVLDAITKEMVEGDTRVYIVGPGKMMELAAKKMVSLGVPEERLFLSMEKLTLCGVGMCGECFCADRLPCKEGTFYSYQELTEYGEMV